MKKEIDNRFTELPKILLNLVSRVMADGVVYSNIRELVPTLKEGENILILNPKQVEQKRIVVKELALHDTPFFKFNKIYNNDNPIPMTEMYGCAVDEKDKMIKMDLWSKDHKVHWSGWLLKSWIVESDNEINKVL